ncbi:hypothetical protein [Methylobacterium oryzisoli]|uniref:hypothetical protein n=1 Tax=Methylobacterium oryzisoli TaxID=3385502 RepID=UPI0038915721
MTIDTGRRPFGPAVRVPLALFALVWPLAALANPCSREGPAVTCADGRRGLVQQDGIVWSDGSVSRLLPPPDVRIGARPSVTIGPGVFVGDGRGGKRVLDDPNRADSARCAILDGIAYCH